MGDEDEKRRRWKYRREEKRTRRTKTTARREVGEGAKGGDTGRRGETRERRKGARGCQRCVLRRCAPRILPAGRPRERTPRTRTREAACRRRRLRFVARLAFSASACRPGRCSRLDMGRRKGTPRACSARHCSAGADAISLFTSSLRRCTQRSLLGRAAMPTRCSTDCQPLDKGSATTPKSLESYPGSNLQIGREMSTGFGN